jgi:hypothetical protein
MSVCTSQDWLLARPAARAQHMRAQAEPPAGVGSACAASADGGPALTRARGADWVEHVAETGSYLRTPEAGMPWAVRNSMDVIAAWAAAAAAVLAAAWGLARLLAGLVWRRLGGQAPRSAPSRTNGKLNGKKAA